MWEQLGEVCISEVCSHVWADAVRLCAAGTAGWGNEYRGRGDGCEPSPCDRRANRCSPRPAERRYLWGGKDSQTQSSAPHVQLPGVTWPRKELRSKAAVSSTSTSSKHAVDSVFHSFTMQLYVYGLLRMKTMEEEVLKQTTINIKHLRGRGNHPDFYDLMHQQGCLCWMKH